MIWKRLKNYRGGFTPTLHSGDVVVGSVFRAVSEPGKMTGRCTLADTPAKAFDTEDEAKAFVEAEFAAWLKRAQLGPT